MERSKRSSLLIALVMLVMVSCLCPKSLNPLAGVQETIGAVASQLPEGALETLQAAATQLPPGAAETALAAIPQAAGSGLLETAQSALDEAGAGQLGTPGAPADIPVLTGEKTIIVETEDIAQYASNQPYADLVNFYKTQMPNNGWQFQPSDSNEADEYTTLVYRKGRQVATISIIDLVVSRSITVETRTE